MDHGHDHGMMGDHGGMTPPTMSQNGTGGGGGMMMHHKMMMHMTFFWGKNTEILFHGWPGTSTGMYIFALFVVFFLAMLVEWFSHSRFIKEGTSHVSAGIVQTVMHTIRVGLSYLVMLAIMSFNGGVFIVAVLGHSVGFLLFGSRVFMPAPPGNPPYEKRSDLPPMTC